MPQFWLLGFDICVVTEWSCGHRPVVEESIFSLVEGSGVSLLFNPHFLCRHQRKDGLSYDKAETFY
jgi:hypothetical protein